jgi:translation initiation factor 3 subunit A
MSHFFQKPENALKRAKELISITNSDAAVLKRTKRSALETLHDALVAKKNRTWQPAHEELMILYLDICLELQLGIIAKDGLHQYRNLSIQHNPASLENVIVHFVNQTEQKLSFAKKQSNEMILLDAAQVDLEAAQTPEAVMLSTISFEDSSDRTDREVVVPWLRFTWETYRTVLDILKCNSKLESLYKTISIKAFDFCMEYSRKIEFRRLCEILRNHLGSLQKHSNAPTSQSSRQMRAWDGFTLESVEILLEIRYRQLQVATELELFSEAFRTIDDINTIMSLLVDQIPRLELMITYYEKLAQIFLVSKNYLFHAYALYKWYSLRVGGLDGLEGGAALAVLPCLVTPEEKKNMATRVVLAALSIPLIDFESASPVLEEEAANTPSSSATTNTTDTVVSLAMREKNSRMAALLGFTTAPSRGKFLDEIEAAEIVKFSFSDTASLFQLVEREEVDPLQIVKQVTPYLTRLRCLTALELKFIQAYMPSVERLLVRRVLFQLTRVYSSISIAHLHAILEGLNVSYKDIEQLIVRSRSLSTVAHVSAPSLSSMYLSTKTCSSSSTSSSSVETMTASVLRTKIRIDHLQQCVRFSDATELEANPSQLSLLGERLSRILKKFSTASTFPSTSQLLLFKRTRETLVDKRMEMLGRKEIIEQKKEQLERLQQEKRRAMEKKRQDMELLRQKIEKERLEQEKKRREMEKKQKIRQEIALKETKQILDQLGRHAELDIADMEKIDHEQILQQAKEKALREKEEAQRKLKESARRLDYIIRATREAEQPILQKHFLVEKEQAKLLFDQENQKKLELLQEEHTIGLKEKKRLAIALKLNDFFIQAHCQRRKEQYKKATEEQKKKTMLERLEKRIANAKQRFEKEQTRIRQEEEEKERKQRQEEEEKERVRQMEIEKTIRQQEEEEQEERRRKIEEEKEKEAVENEAHVSEGHYRPPSAVRRSERVEEEWTQVGPKRDQQRPAAPEGKWERRGPPPREDSLRSRFSNRPSFSSGEDRGINSFRRGGGEDDRGGFRRGGAGEDDRRLHRGGEMDREVFRGSRDERGPSSRGGAPPPRGGEAEEKGSWRGAGTSSSERNDRDRVEPSFRRNDGLNRDRESSDDRFFGSRREGSYRPPRAGGDNRGENDRVFERGGSDSRRGGFSGRAPTKAPDSGRWR